MTSFIKKYFLSIYFLVAVVIGVITHEFGHHIAGKLLGYNTEVYYAYTTFKNTDGSPVIYSTETKLDYFIFEAGGVLVTILLGTLGFILLFKIKKRDGVLYWSLILLSLFWVRSIFVLATSLIQKFLLKTTITNDEVGIAFFFNVSPWVIIITLGLIAIIICLTIFTKFITPNNRWSFLGWALISAPVAYFFWFQLVGPMLKRIV